MRRLAILYDRDGTVSRKRGSLIEAAILDVCCQFYEDQYGCCVSVHVRILSMKHGGFIGDDYEFNWG